MGKDPMPILSRHATKAPTTVSLDARGRHHDGIDRLAHGVVRSCLRKQKPLNLYQNDAAMWVLLLYASKANDAVLQKGIGAG